VSFYYFEEKMPVWTPGLRDRIFLILVLILEKQVSMKILSRFIWLRTEANAELL